MLVFMIAGLSGVRSGASNSHFSRNTIEKHSGRGK
ncbi:glucose-inducible SAM-dependent methyltransferase Rrg1 [Histoplasma ohiense]|nr:glucose-inducible SAM-dependent methyltransferase Rrg1 [Histoplasma ohiense (nom. inval.)]